MTDGPDPKSTGTPAADSPSRRRACAPAIRPIRTLLLPVSRGGEMDRILAEAEVASGDGAIVCIALVCPPGEGGEGRGFLGARAEDWPSLVLTIGSDPSVFTDSLGEASRIGRARAAGARRRTDYCH